MGAIHAYRSIIGFPSPKNFCENINPARPKINPPMADLPGYFSENPGLKTWLHSEIGIVNNLDPIIVNKDTVVNISKTDRKGIFRLILNTIISTNVTAKDNI